VKVIRKVQSFIAVDEGTQKCLTEELLDAAYQCPPKLMPSLPENHPLLHLEVSEMKLATKIWIEAAVQDVENLKEFGQAVMNQSDALHGVVGHLITKLYEQQDAIALLKDELQATKVSSKSTMSKERSLQLQIQSPAALVEEKVKDEPPMTTEKFERELASIEEDAAKKVKKDADVGFAEGVHLLMCKMAHLKDAVTNSSLSRILAEKDAQILHQYQL
jgi:hypothetical protein